MAKITKFNQLHLELIPRLWDNEKIPSKDYFEMLFKIGIDIQKISFPPQQFTEGVTHYYRIENQETTAAEHALGQEISRLIHSVSFEKVGSEYFLVHIAPSRHLSNWLWTRNKTLQYRTMRPLPIIDAIIEKMNEINLLFMSNRKLFKKPMPGEKFLDFLQKNNLSPFIWFWDYCDRKNAGYSGTVFTTNPSNFSWPLPRLTITRAQKGTGYRGKNLAQRSLVAVSTY